MYPEEAGGNPVWQLGDHEVQTLDCQNCKCLDCKLFPTLCKLAGRYGTSQYQTVRVKLRDKSNFHHRKRSVANKSEVVWRQLFVAAAAL